MRAKRNMTRFDRVCPVCGTAFQVTMSQIRKGADINCSRACRDEARRKQFDLTCQQCGKTYTRSAWHVERSKFCSVPCRNAADKGKRPVNWSGPVLMTYGYVFVNHPSRPKRIRQHRLVMEQILGRPLRSDEHVHHINGDRADNRPENLQIMSAAEHAALHGSRIGWARHFDCCIDCGKTELRHAGNGRCERCRTFHRYSKAHD